MTRAHGQQKEQQRDRATAPRNEGSEWPSRLASARSRRVGWARWWPALLCFLGLLLIPFLTILLFRAEAPRRRTRPGHKVAARRPLAAATPSARSAVRAARMVIGVVSDEGDEPVVGAQISIGDDKRLRTVSASGGRYHIRAVPLEALQLQVRAPGFETARLALGLGSAGQRQVLDVQLRRASAVAGVVLDPDGRPIAGANVGCTDRPGDPTLGGTSDDKGRFAMRAEAAGCSAVARHMRFGESPPVILAGGDRNQLRMGRGGRIDGEVVDERGRPIQKFSISIDTFRAARSTGAGRAGQVIQVDDPAGRFRLEGLTAGSYVLAASTPQRPPAHSESIDVEENGRRRVRIELLEGGVIKGQVRDVDSKAPIAGAAVALDMAVMTGRRARPVRSDPSGHYELEGVPRRGMFSVSVSARGYNRRILSGLSLEGRKAMSRDAELTPKSRVDRNVEYSGIGASIGSAKDGIVLGAVFPGGPADQAGLRVRDVLVRIDGRDASKLSVVHAIQLLRGPDGSQVSLSVQREGGKKLDVVLTRRPIVMK